MQGMQKATTLLMTTGVIEMATRLSVLGEVFERLDGISLHGGLSLGPVGRADLSVLVGELEGLDQA